MSAPDAGGNGPASPTDNDKPLDLLVIGTGEAGATVAVRCQAAGWKVAIVDSRPYGGTCGLRGCDPKKVLVSAAEAIDWVRRMQGKGIQGESAIDWPDLMRFKRTFTDPFSAAREDSFKQAGVATWHGTAKFTGRDRVQISHQAGATTITARHVLIGVGAWPVRLDIPGEDHLTTSDRFMELDSLPKRILFVGGGYIAFEFAHMAARAGAQVTIVHQGERPLERFDPDLVARLVERTRALGIDVNTSMKVTAIEVIGGAAFRVTAVGGVGGAAEQRFEADLVVHAAGRTPEIAGLDLPAAGVEADIHGVAVNEYMQSVSNPGVYAAGDAANSGAWPNTPGADYTGTLAARNLLEGNHHKADFLGGASVVYTVPPLTRVGLLEDEARQQGLRFEVHQGDTAAWYAARKTNEPCSAFKVLVEEKTHHILGAHLVGPQAEELANIFILAIRTGITAETLREIHFAYPTQASNLQWML